MSRHRRSKFSALSMEAGNSLRQRAEQYARTGGRPDEGKGTVQEKAAALEPMRNHQAAQMGQQHKEGLAPGNYPTARGGAVNDPERTFQPVDSSNALTRTDPGRSSLPAGAWNTATARVKPAKITGDRVFRRVPRQRLSGTANDHENRGSGPLRGELMSRLVSMRRKNTNPRRRLF